MPELNACARDEDAMNGTARWASAIGYFLINFGMLDWLVFVFLERRMSPGDFAKIREEHLKDRIVRVQRLIGEQPLSKERQRAFVEFFARLEPIRELRNHIAHGHLQVRMVEDCKTWVLELSVPKDLDASYATGTRHLGIGELTQALSDLSELIDEFQKITGDWHFEKIVLQNVHGLKPSTG